MKDILAKRTHILQEAKKSPFLQQIEMEACRRDILYFFNNYLYTEKNSTYYSDETPSIVPFIPFEFQIEYIEQVWESIWEGNKPIKDRSP